MKRWLVAWVVAGLAALAWGHAVLMLVQAHEQPSPARVVHFMVDGKPSEIDVHCHGAAIVVGDSIWQECREFQGTQTAWLTRFDLRAGIGELHAVERGVGMMMGAALHADGTLALATYEGLFVIQNNKVERVVRSDRLYRGIGWLAMRSR
ncbi:MAG: hypothetical protein H0T46_12690 [Deltaproteobacteria bacterium]|nr:hypothetical protein [Deltaproteobacteria bacterium]